MTRPTTYLFDLDGTLVDSLADLATGLNLLRASHELAPLPLEEVRRNVGDGARKLVERSLPMEHQGDEAVRQFLTHYSQHVTDQTRPYPGIIHLLEQLTRQGANLGVITNKPIALTHPILEGLELSRFFGVVLGGDSVPQKKPAPDMVLQALDRLNGRPDETLVVGDHHTDLRAGKAAGVRTCFCEWGFGHTDGLAPDYSARSSQQLSELLLSLQ